MESIVVATHFSETSQNAVLYAAGVAKSFGVKLVLFNAFQMPLHGSNRLTSAASVDLLIEKSKDKLKEMAGRLENDFNITVTYSCIYAQLELEIDYVMQSNASPLLIMGMSNKSLEQNLMGNPTTSLISMKNFPVLAVPRSAQFTGISKILFACDLAQSIPVKILAKLRSIAQKLESEVTVFYVENEIQSLQSKAKALVAIEDELEGVVHFYKNIKSNTVIASIEKEVVNAKADLLVMTPKKYGFWESLIHRSKTRMMASGLHIPLLSIPLE